MLKIRFLLDKAKIEQHWLSKSGAKSVSEDVFLETEKFKKTIEQKWEGKELLISAFFEQVTGIKLEGDFVVSVLHPSLEIAHYNDGHNIEWGYNELYPNYIVIGLAHELLHCLTHIFYTALTGDQKWIFHAIIYLSMNEQLRFELNGKSEYFSVPTIKTYHKRLIETAKNILPYYKKYIEKSGPKNIFDFYERISKLNPGM